MALVMRLCAIVCLVGAVWAGPIAADYDRAGFLAALAAVNILLAREAAA